MSTPDLSVLARIVAAVVMLLGAWHEDPYLLAVGCTFYLACAVDAR